jgi:hypothetical protein
MAFSLDRRFRKVERHYSLAGFLGLRGDKRGEFNRVLILLYAAIVFAIVMVTVMLLMRDSSPGGLP